MDTKGTEKASETAQDKLLKVGRRALLKVAGAASVGLPLAAFLGRAPWRGPRVARAQESPRTRESYWQDGYFVHENVDASQFEQGIIRARVDGEWRDFYNRTLGDDFVDWNIGARITILRDPMAGMACLDGPHSGCLATYGANRGDSAFTLNAAFKGFGLYPRMDRFDDAMATVMDNWSASQMAKIDILLDFYNDRDLWDLRLLSSLELYTTQEFETHSFLNQMANPVAVINWLAIPGSFEVRAIARLIHPDDPDVPEDDWKRARWVNAMHDFFHGGPTPNPDSLPFIACIYYPVEVFDNSPYPGPMGVRVHPPL